MTRTKKGTVARCAGLGVNLANVHAESLWPHPLARPMPAPPGIDVSDLVHQCKCGMWLGPGDDDKHSSWHSMSIRCRLLVENGLVPAGKYFQRIRAAGASYLVHTKAPFPRWDMSHILAGGARVKDTLWVTRAVYEALKLVSEGHTRVADPRALEIIRAAGASSILSPAAQELLKKLKARETEKAMKKETEDNDATNAF